MLRLNSSELSNDSKSYLLSVLLDPEEIINLVIKRFNSHLNELAKYNSNDVDTVQVRSIIDLLSKDYRLIFDLNYAITDLSNNHDVKVFSNSYLNFVETTLQSILKRFNIEEL